MTDAQEAKLRTLCERYGVEFDRDDYHPQFDLPPGYVAGWVGGLSSQPPIRTHSTIYVGVSPEGDASS